MPKISNRENKLSSDQTYNHSTLRFTACVFGSLFSQIKIHGYNKDGSINYKKLRSVTLAYAAKDVYAYWIEQQMRTPPGNTEIDIMFPRMSFELTGLQLASQRGINTNLPIYSKNVTSNGTTMGSLTPVAYAFDYSLDIWCKHMDDSIQILDQILPMFAPSISIKVKESKVMGIVNDMTITLTGVSKDDNYMEQFDTQRIVHWTLSFTVYADLIPTYSTEEKALVKQAIIDSVEDAASSFVNGQDPSFFNYTETDRYGNTTTAKRPGNYYGGNSDSGDGTEVDIKGRGGKGMYGEIILEKKEDGKGHSI